MDMTQYAGSESKYLKASDLQGRTPTVVIESVSLVEFGDDDGGKKTKPTCKLVGKEKELTLSPSFVEEFNRAFGPNSENWIGQSIRLSVKYYKAYGKEGIVPYPLPVAVAVPVAPPAPPAAPAPAPAPTPEHVYRASPDEPDSFDDDIPF